MDIILKDSDFTLDTQKYTAFHTCPSHLLSRQEEMRSNLHNAKGFHGYSHTVKVHCILSETNIHLVPIDL